MNALTGRLKAIYTAMVVFLTLVVTAPAHAALPAGVATFFGDLTADFTELLNTYWFPILFVVVGGLILMKWLKRGAKAAT